MIVCTVILHRVENSENYSTYALHIRTLHIYTLLLLIQARVSQSVLAHQDRGTSQSEGPHQIGGALPNKDRPAMQLYQPGTRKCMGSASKGYELPSGQSPEHVAADHCYEAIAMGTGSEKSSED